MPFLKRIKNRVNSDFYRYQFLRAAKRILESPPLARGTEPFIVLSMVHHRDVFTYLVAIRSFALQANPHRVVVVCDPTLNQRDQSIIRSQVPHIEFRAADEFVHPSIPRGGCWERLYAISEYAQSDYIVQLDADTVTTAPILEVIDAVRNQKGFVIGEEENQRLVTFDEAEEKARPWQNPDVHIQGLAEVLLSETSLVQRLYVRGCAGFTGFPPLLSMRTQLIEFSRQMEQLAGERWKEWGTEQVASNYLVANQRSTSVLPFPKYATPDVATANTSFVHFIGSMRFTSNAYELAAVQAIQALSQKRSG